MCYRLGYVPEAELSLPAGKAFLSTVSSCTVSHCKVPETCRGWVGGSEPCECHCLAGGNHIFSISQLVCAGSGFCPISSLMAIREISNEYLSLKLPMKLPYSGCRLLFVPGSPSPAHSPPSSRSLFSVSMMQWLLSHAHSLCLSFHPHRLPASIIIPGHIMIFPLLLSESAGQNYMVSFFPKHSWIPGRSLHSQPSTPGNPYTSEYYRGFLSCSPKDTLYIAIQIYVKMMNIQKSCQNLRTLP